MRYDAYIYIYMSLGAKGLISHHASISCPTVDLYVKRNCRCARYEFVWGGLRNNSTYSHHDQT